MELNRPAPDFELPGLDGHLHRLSDYHGKIVIINFWSAECPHSERADRLLTARLKQWGADVRLLSIAANRNEPIPMLEEAAKARRLPLVLIDAQLAVADEYGAQTTPHVFVVDRQGILRYRGAVDDVTFCQRVAQHFYLEEAVEALLEGRQPAPAETPAYGCAIVREV